ncbi:MAG: hypothetical protein HND48_23910 [Chloroflexi bacterium]|nr:hypothetical protein [Chloroflexota bacterium]
MIVPVSEAGEPWQVRHDHDLMPVRERPQLLADDRADTPANALIDLVEDQRRGVIGGGQHALEGEHDTRRFAAAGDFGERPQRLARIGAQQHFDFVDAGGVEGEAALSDDAPVRIVVLLDPNLELGALHAQIDEFTHHALGEPACRPSCVPR